MVKLRESQTIIIDFIFYPEIWESSQEKELKCLSLDIINTSNRAYKVIWGIDMGILVLGQDEKSQEVIKGLGINSLRNSLNVFSGCMKPRIVKRLLNITYISVPPVMNFENSHKKVTFGGTRSLASRTASAVAQF